MSVKMLTQWLHALESRVKKIEIKNLSSHQVHDYLLFAVFLRWNMFILFILSFYNNKTLKYPFK